MGGGVIENRGSMFILYILIPRKLPLLLVKALKLKQNVDIACPKTYLVFKQCDDTNTPFSSSQLFNKSPRGINWALVHPWRGFQLFTWQRTTGRDGPLKGLVKANKWPMHSVHTVAKPINYIFAVKRYVQMESIIASVVWFWCVRIGRYQYHSCNEFLISHTRQYTQELSVKLKKVFLPYQ